ncbi:HD-GYP domain-containing protein [Marinisporobacter balticus]|uniref:HD-GYP domain-containing protein (C-di-GMP phosphodiesterase class II) n=1 Tax=Marinisporobacter balticus TaxID=2018667 RepID=A0A4R2KDE2_9FIRM|nr:HD-GYP domain-containing protein [Marinisporobacter balticus]TCO68249.1 HD-GYP domain-containing protein (c-di-GMP phosphodiesterase class II) [Marinisporobacter balticus]
MRLVPIDYAKEGMYLAQTLNDRNNRILLQKGIRLNQNLLERIKENGIYSIYIHDEYSDNEIEDIISPKLRNSAITTIKDTFDNLDQYFGQNNNSIKAKQLLQTREKNLQSLNSISKEVVEEILTGENMVINLVDVKSIDNYTYRHSVNVAVLSLVLGIELGLNKDELYDLCIGAMLHDVGKSFIPKEILLKREALTNQEYEIVKEHAKKGYDYLKERYDLNTSVKLIALQHHERIDGSGYPYGYTENKINKLSKIVAIADTYDAMVSDTPYRKALPANEAIELIMGSAGGNFDFDMVRVFIKKIIPYPVGSLVQLSNGEIGVVEEIKPDFPLRPKVKVVKQNAVTVEMKNFDLMKETNVVIDGILYEVPNACVPRQLGNENSFNEIR